MDNVTNIEPADNEERLLKGILENISGGGGGTAGLIVTLTASGDDYTGDKSVTEIKSVIDGGGCVYLSYPDGDMRIIAEYTDDTSLRIGVFSEDEYIVYSVVDDGNNGITLAVVSSKYMAEPYVIVPTPTSQTEGTVPAGTFDKVTELLRKGMPILMDLSVFTDSTTAGSGFVMALAGGISTYHPTTTLLRVIQLAVITANGNNLEIYFIQIKPNNTYTLIFKTVS